MPGTTAVPYSNLLIDWCRALRAEGKDADTIRIYGDSARNLINWVEPGQTITHRTVQAFLGELVERTSPGYGSIHYRSLQQYFRWLLTEEEITVDPMVKVKPIPVPLKPVPVVTADEFKRLMKVSDHRDQAILLTLKNSGLRVGELVGIQCEHLDLNSQIVKVTGKGSKTRFVPLDDTTCTAISKYMRSSGHPRTGALWIGRRGILTRSGVEQMLARRCRAAGLARVHPHQLRHTFAHQALSAGISEGSLMRLAGWSSRSMLSRYGASMADQRAHEEFRKLKLGS